LTKAKKEGIEAFLEEQDRGGGVITQNRPNAPTRGQGNALPDAEFYRITAPARDRQTGLPFYTGMTAGLTFINGHAWTNDKELAWRLQWDFHYEVEVEEDVSRVKMVPGTLVQGASPGL
jgi:hypothetical protein